MPHRTPTDKPRYLLRTMTKMVMSGELSTVAMTITREGVSLLGDSESADMYFDTMVTWDELKKAHAGPDKTQAEDFLLAILSANYHKIHKAALAAVEEPTQTTDD